MAFATAGLGPVQNYGSNFGSYGLGGPSLFGGSPSLGTSTQIPGLGLNPLMPGGGDMANTAMAQQEVMLGAMLMLLTALMANGGQQGAGSNTMPAIAGLGSSFGNDAMGSSSPAGGTGGTGAAGGANNFPSAGATGGGAEASVKMAEQFVGSTSIGVKGKLANFTAAGGTGNNCADFVSAILANTQGFKKTPGDASVATFKKHLVEQGWRKVSKEQSKPGDVVIFNGSQHTELVTKAGGKEAIGSNGGATNQMIKRDSLQWGAQEYYTKG